MPRRGQVATAMQQQLGTMRSLLLIACEVQTCATGYMPTRSMCPNVSYWPWPSIYADPLRHGRRVLRGLAPPLEPAHVLLERDGGRLRR